MIGILTRWLDDQEGDLVEKARADGHSWSVIGLLLGRSKRSVWERYASSPDDDYD